jgi:hypothetical protein
MASKNQPDRAEATLLAAAMAVLGGPFLFDKLGSLVQSGVLSASMVLHAAPVLLIVAGAILLLTEPSLMSEGSGTHRSKEGQHEL